MKKSIGLILVLMLPVILIIQSCGEDDTGINIFSVEDDMELGLQIQQEIQSNPAEYPLLNPSQYPDAYGHLTRVRDSILSSNLVKYDDQFEWDVHIIRDDSVLNAFCTPGGYIYFYTGLIKFLDDESEFAGVVGHEMAHAARRHSTEQMTKAYGIQMLVSIVLGQNPNALAQIAADLAAGIASLAFSRDDEYESDEYAVKYMYETAYDATGVAGFFEKLEGSPQAPEFLSTHPSPENRVEKINEIWQELGGKAGETFAQRYNEFKNTLP